MMDGYQRQVPAATTIFVGTPLTGRPRALQQSADSTTNPVVNKYQQELTSGLVTDFRGGQRLHGAFHGGFSAGYFNTVGSIQGFTPASFSSSRRTPKGTENPRQRPEDFMDEEDRLEHAQLGTNVKRRSQFSSDAIGSTASELANRSAEVAPGIVVTAPITRSIGVMLLQRMGWIRGQPIGKKKISGFSVRIYAPQPDPATDKSVVSTKGDVYGLGYNAPSTFPMLNSSYGSRHEVYEVASSSAYDTSISVGVDDESKALPLREVSRTRNDTHFRNNQNKCLRGFVLSVSTVLPTPTHQIKVPNGFIPSSCPVSSFSSISITAGLEQFRSNIEYVASIRRRQLSMADRSAALGEKATETSSQQPSVFEMISGDDKAKLSASLSSMFRVGSTLIVGEEKDAIHFPNDPAKQSRFQQFLKHRSSGATGDPLPGNDWKAVLELQQFEALAATMPSYAMPKIEEVRLPEIPIDFDSAARLKMFGALTRENTDWVPPRLLCKRFHVPDPYQGRAVPTPTPGRQCKFQELLATVNPELAAAAQNRPDLDRPEVSLPTHTTTNHEEDEDEVVVETFEKPPVDLFKAIFEDSDDDDVEDFPIKAEPVAVETASNALGAVPSSSLMVDKKPRGLLRLDSTPDIASSRQSTEQIPERSPAPQPVTSLPVDQKFISSTYGASHRSRSRSRSLHKDNSCPSRTDRIYSDRSNRHAKEGKRSRDSYRSDDERRTRDRKHRDKDSKKHKHKRTPEEEEQRLIKKLARRLKKSKASSS
uniref:G-patch domain-containing protein n=1 Tax=Spongospora subterranea TaxID=70186 RepID=A0A0H5RGM2_9EUKA|eukprot:CRZ07819.1 hypothetical protein [Spongospora subterranea]